MTAAVYNDDVDGGERVTFSTGRYMEPNCGIIGIGPDGKATEGYWLR